MNLNPWCTWGGGGYYKEIMRGEKAGRTRIICIYMRIKVRFSEDNEILHGFDCVIYTSSNKIRYSLRLSGETLFDNGRKYAVYSPYNRIVLSTSPREFFAAQWYVPTSFFCRRRMVRIIRTSNCDFNVTWTSCLLLDIIIAPLKQMKWIERLATITSDREEGL